MIGMMVSTLFWNNVLNARMPETPRITSHRVWESSFSPQSKYDKNKEFYTHLVRPKEEPKEIVVTSDFQKKKLFPMAPIHIPQKVLIIAPHPDDEILCCANTIKNHLLAGDDVSIVVITNGDGKERGDKKQSLDYGTQRRNESLRAAKRLGISPRKVMFLGFPDGYLSEIEQKGSARSAFTQLIQTMRASFFPGTPYTWNGLQRSLRKVLKKSEATIIYLPNQKDTHPDHQVAARAIRAAAHSLKLVPEWKEYMVHFEEKVCIKKELDRDKLSLIREFRTQRHDRLHAAFLDQFASCEEQFISIPGLK